MHKFVKLLKNHIYPTYQLHAVMKNNKLDPCEGLVLGALTVCEWLRNRLGDDIPDVLQLPTADHFREVKLEQLLSLHLNYGFVVDIISIPEKGMWSLQIVEPDLGSDPGNPNQLRKPVAGRIIETNVAFCINNNKLECGVKTVISDPENADLAYVYRPAFVKKLYNNRDFGLRQVADIEPWIKFVDSAEQLKNMANIYNDSHNQLPFLILTKVKEISYEDALPLESVTVNQLKKKINGKYDDNGNYIKNIEVENTYSKKEAAKASKKNKEKSKQLTEFGARLLRVLADNPLFEKEGKTLEEQPKRKQNITYQMPPYDVRGIAGKLAGFAHVYAINERLQDKFCEMFGVEVSAGDVIILEPLCFGGDKHIYPLAQKDNNEKEILRAMFCYPREKAVDFHNIYFLAGAKDALIQGKRELEESSEAQMNEWELRLLAMQRQNEALVKSKENEISNLETKNSALRQEIAIEEGKRRQLAKQIEDIEEKHKQELADQNAYIDFLKRRNERPRTKKELVDWLAKTQFEHMLIHKKAMQTLEAANLTQERVEFIYDALDYMATDFWENRYGFLSSEDLNILAGKKYGRGFTITPCMGSSIEVYPEQYKISYFKDEKGVAKPSDLNFHLKVGNKSEHMVRIYFLFDDVKKLIVVGSMPDHLSTVTFG